MYIIKSNHRMKQQKIKKVLSRHYLQAYIFKKLMFLLLKFPFSELFGQYFYTISSAGQVI